MFAALLDTSVLWPSLQRDFLLSLAVEGMYRPLWSTEILAELEYCETAKLIERGEPPDTAIERASYLIRQMTAAFDDALVENWEPHDGTFDLPDPDDEHDDEHVVAAALVGGAGVIVTNNLEDFPIAKMATHIKVLSPSQFAADTVSVSPYGGVPRLPPNDAVDLAQREMTSLLTRRLHRANTVRAPRSLPRDCHV
jgi:predicted nucleic acid-binding protein